MNKLIKKYKQFLYHDTYLLLLVLITTFCWAIDNYLLGMIILAIFGISAFLVADDTKPLIPITAYYPYVLSANEIYIKKWPNTDFFIFLIISVPLGIAALIYHLKKRQFRLSQIKRGSLFIGSVIAIMGIITAGIAHPNYKFIYTVGYVGTGLGMFFFYIVFLNTLNKGVSRYLAKVLIFAGVAIILQMTIHYLRADNLINELKTGALRIGWGMRNTLAVILAMAIPMFYYLGYKCKQFYLYLIGSFIFYIALVFTFSRGNLLFFTILSLPLIIYTYLITSYKKQLLISISFFIIISISFFYLYNDLFKELMGSYYNRGLYSAGRLTLWKEAFNLWLNYPVFGVGFFGELNEKFHGALLKVHSTPLQILASAGIIGLLSFIKYYYDRYRFYFKRLHLNDFAFFSFIALLAYEAYGVIDLTLFMIYQIFFVIWFFVAIEIDEKKT